MTSYEFQKLITKLEELEEKIDEQDKRMEKMESYLERQKGFIGGILFIGSCVGWLVSYLKDWWK